VSIYLPADYMWLGTKERTLHIGSKEKLAFSGNRPLIIMNEHYVNEGVVNAYS
jgi:hypothetical protein